MTTVDNSKVQCYGTYSDIAVEYYNPMLHPTCANFREASKILLIPWLRKLTESSSRILEVGAGRSVVAEWRMEDCRSLAGFVVTDATWEMLLYSRGENENLDLMVCDAERLPFASGSFDLLVSSLGDGYNTMSFWREATRVIRKGGYILFTTPAFDWAQQFRNGVTLAEFWTQRGKTVTVKSYVETRGVQHQIIIDAGLQVVYFNSIDRGKLRTTLQSPKLRSGPIVSIYIARKQPSSFNESKE